MNKPTIDESPAKLEQRSRELFNERVANMDAPTRSRLNQARHAALALAANNSRTFTLRWLVPVGSVAALALVGLVTLQFMRGGEFMPAQPTTAIEDMEIIASNDELDLLQNVEFYDWIDSDDANTSGEAGSGEAG